MKSVLWRPGFTIVEVMLFLTISVLLVVSLVASINSMIRYWQYRDAVQSYANFLRDQHDQVINVQNARSSGRVCGPDVTHRGQSNCMVIGRYIRTASDDTSGELVAYPVFARQVAGGAWEYSLGSQDASYLTRYGVQSHLSNQSHDAADMSLLMYRHPADGTLIVRSDDTIYTSTTVGELMRAAASTEEREVCMGGGWMVGTRQSIFLSAYAGSSSAITVGEAKAEGCKNA